MKASRLVFVILSLLISNQLCKIHLEESVELPQLLQLNHTQHNLSDSKQFTATDLHKIKRLSSPVLSNDRKYIVFSVRLWNETTGKVSSHLEFTDLSTNRTSIITEPGLYSDSTPIFNSEFPNLLFFLSTRSSSSQIWYVNFPPTAQPATPVQLTNYSLGIDNLKFKNYSFVFSTEVYFDCLEDIFNCTSIRNAEVSARGGNTWGVYSKLFVRHWDRWLTEGKGSHLFLQKVSQSEGNVILLGDPIDLMLGMEANSPVEPFGGSEQFDIRPDGNEVVFTAHLRDKDESWSTSWKIYIMNIVTMKNPLHLTKDIKARTQNPRYSPDGTKITYLAMNRPGLESDNLHIELYDSMTNSFTKVTDFFDNSIIDYSWLDGNTLLFTTTEINTNKLFIVDITHPKGTLTRLTDDQYSYNAPITKDYKSGSMIVQRSSWTTPDELATFNLNISNRTITDNKINRMLNINEEVLNQLNFKDCESFMFEGGYGDKVQGWILKPKDFQESKKYPLAFLIHGGPEGAWESSWSYRWNPQIFANRGYAVVMINPHGSSGQGIKFQDAVRDDWGGVPYQDLMKGLDYAIGKYTYIDSDRMCACGASYGGYMVNWIQGQTDRFKCLVTHDGVFSTLSMFYATEEMWFPYAEYCPRSNIGCSPYDPKFRERYLKFSPESYVQNWKTPHMIIHGTNDFRIPVSEGLSAFTALQTKGIPSKFLHFYQENHWVLRAENSIIKFMTD
jgi:dipeptidyl aminopeptidase/acylaminoacyl peptidase